MRDLPSNLSAKLGRGLTLLMTSSNMLELEIRRVLSRFPWLQIWAPWEVCASVTSPYSLHAWDVSDGWKSIRETLICCPGEARIFRCHWRPGEKQEAVDSFLLEITFVESFKVKTPSGVQIWLFAKTEMIGGGIIIRGSDRKALNTKC